MQQSKLAALGRLSASIAHEIRNPVGAMSHAGQLLAESPNLADEDRRLTEIIRNNADRVSGIIDNVLRLSRREQARIERLSLPAWTEEFHEEFCETMQWPRERLTLTGPAGDLEVRVDPSQLRQIVWNLCENALKHAVGDDARTAGRDTIRPHEWQCPALSGSRRPRRAAWRASTWSGSSSPSSAAAAAPAWVCSWRASSPRPMARRCCTSRAPAAAACSGWYSPIRAGGRSDERDAAGSAQRSGDQPTVLIVDDEPDLLELVSLTLSRMNLSTRTAPDLAAAREAAQDASTSTCASPTCACPTATDWIWWPGSRRTAPTLPVAVITAHGNVESAVRALKLGAFDFVSKPLDLGVLRKLVGSAIQLGATIDEETAATLRGPRLLGSFGGHGAAARDDRARRAQPGAGAHLRRVRHRQGTGRAADPRERRAPRRARSWR